MRRGRENKPHIGIFGCRNVGKSSLINSIAGQDIAIVSDQPGTTTDPVRKSFEITGFGPVILIDTAGIDDSGELGSKRIERTLASLKFIDLALILITENRWSSYEENILCRLEEDELPYIVVFTKSDTSMPADDFSREIRRRTGSEMVLFSSITGEGGDELLKRIVESIPDNLYRTQGILGDTIRKGDIVLLITPIDTEAPEGRMILPQVQAIRDALDKNAIAIVTKETELDGFLERSGIIPALAITDSQVFAKANRSIPPGVPLTSFSIALARLKGDFEGYLKGTPVISLLEDGDRILLLESCSHQVSCDDIGRVKLPTWISSFTGKSLSFDIVAGLDSITRPMTDYSLVIQCGGCMITRRQLKNRLQPAIKAGVPVTNYGMAIAWVQGVFNRAISPFAPGRKSV